MIGVAESITPAQMRSIYSYARRLGIADGTRQDPLHQLIGAEYGVESVKQLTCQQAGQLREKLQDQCRDTAQPSGRPEPISDGQIRKVYALMHQLMRYDRVPSTATVRQRICGIIRRELRIDAPERAPFKWLDYQQGGRLIEKIKVYITTAESRRRREETPHGRSG